MSTSKLQTVGLSLLLIAGFAARAQAQLDSPHSPFYSTSNDLQFFEPVDLDLDGRGVRYQTGFFFSYDKIFWATSGERIEIGDPDTVQQMFRLLPGIPLDPVSGQPIQPPLLTNSIMNAVPRSVIGHGDRYEFGYWHDDGSAWLMSVLDGPDKVQTFRLGINAREINESRFIDFPDIRDPDDVDDLILDPRTQEGTQDPAVLPLGDVFVSFRTSPGLLAGFLDLSDGPFNDILNDDTNGDGELDGDGFHDDINGNGQHGAQGFDTDGDGIPDTFIVGVLPDFGDLVTLVTAFQDVRIKNTTKFNGFELMRAHRLDNRHFMVKHQNNRFEWQYGARFLQFDDRFLFDGLSGLSLGDMRVDQQIVNDIVGPQIGYKWLHSRGRWTFNTTGKFLAGFNVQDWTQTGFIAEDATPSRANHPLFLRPKSFSYGRADYSFSPVAELRVNLDYRLTDNVKVQVGYNGTFAGNIRRASTHVDWALFENGKVMGFRDVNEGEDLFSHGVNIGFEVNQ